MIEKIFNQLGCYSVAPIASLEQFFTYIRYAYHPFDIVLINHQMAIQEGVDIRGYCSGNDSVRNFLIYRSSEISILNLAALRDHSYPEGTTLHFK